MALAVPTDTSRVVTSRALGLASVWGSGVLLVATVFFVIGFDVDVPQVNIALALAGLGVAGLVVAWSLMVSNPWLVVGLMLIAGAGVFVFTVEVQAGLGSGWESDAAVFAAPKIALTVAGVAGRTLPAALARSSLGFAVATIGVDLGTQVAGRPSSFDQPATVVWLSIVVALFVIWWGRVQSIRSMISRRAAAEVEERRTEHSRVSAVASATLYDSVLNDLHALAVSTSGQLTDEHRAFLARDIASLAHPGLLVDEAMISGRSSTAAVEESGLGSVVRSSAARGLQVIVSGDPARLAELDSEVRVALMEAVEQVLVGVSRREGIDVADVSVTQGSDAVTVMVCDDGIGFDPATSSTELPGTTFALRDCLERLDGSVRVWSAPGRGTAVFLSVPSPQRGQAA